MGVVICRKMGPQRTRIIMIFAELNLDYINIITHNSKIQN
jgi:hypothetical protein